MAATPGALSGSQSLSGASLTVAEQNSVIGYPAAETYPGPLTEDHSDPGPADPGRSGPPNGPVPDIPATGSMPDPDLSGGTIPDVVADLGHSAPMAAFDSSAGAPFAPSGPIAPTHGDDTGGTGRKEHVPVPRSPGWWRRTLTGQTFNRQAQVTDNAGWQISAPNGRQNLDQAQGQNANGYDPAVIPYSERPLRANLAAEAYPIQDTAGGYVPDGSLPDMYGLGGQGNYVYTTPPDPTTNVQPPTVGQPAAYQPVLGMEYVSG
jgi:hypothetical protein